MVATFTTLLELVGREISDGIFVTTVYPIILAVGIVVGTCMGTLNVTLLGEIMTELTWEPFGFVQVMVVESAGLEAEIINPSVELYEMDIL